MLALTLTGQVGWTAGRRAALRCLWRLHRAGRGARVVAKVQRTRTLLAPSVPAPRTGPWAQPVPMVLGLEDNLQVTPGEGTQEPQLVGGSGGERETSAPLPPCGLGVPICDTRALDLRGPPLQNAGSCSGCLASHRGLLSHRGDEFMSPGLHSKPASQKPGLRGSPPPGKAGPPESTAWDGDGDGDGGEEREPDFRFQGKRCARHTHAQPEASVPDPGHPCGAGAGAGGPLHYPPAVRPGTVPPPRGLGFSICRTRGSLRDGPPSPPVPHALVAGLLHGSLEPHGSRAAEHLRRWFPRPLQGGRQGTPGCPGPGAPENGL